jgi:hypothetical protein
MAYLYIIIFLVKDNKYKKDLCRSRKKNELKKTLTLNITKQIKKLK